MTPQEIQLKQINQLENEKKILKEQLDKAHENWNACVRSRTNLLEQLADAEEALKYYANPHHYAATPRPLGVMAEMVTKLLGDHEEVSNSRGVMVAGMRARDYFQRYEK